MKWSKCVLLFLFSSLILSLAFNLPQNLGFLCFFFLIPIFFYLEKTKEEGRIKKDFVLMGLFALLVTFCSTYWFAGVYPLDWMGIHNNYFSFLLVFGLWGILAVFLSLPITFWIILARLNQFTNIFNSAIFFAFSWSLLEYFRAWFMALGIYGKDLAFGPHHAYYSLTYLITNIPYIKEVVPIGGMYLGSFTIVMVNFLVFSVIKFLLDFKNIDRKSARIVSPQILSLFILIVATILFSNIYMNKLRQNEYGERTEFYLGRAQLPSTRSMSIHDMKTDQAVQKIREKITDESSPNIYILPESFDLYNKSATDKNIFSKDILVIGSYASGRENMYYLDTKTGLAGIYNKKILMPIGEYKIYYIDLFTKVFFRETGSELPDLQIGTTPSVLKYGELTFGSSVCAENISPILTRDSVLNGANVLVNVSSHAPFGVSGLLNRQTIAINTIRALETGRYLITAKNFGDSFVISDKGEQILKTDTTMKDLSLHKTYFFTKWYLTPYVIFGDYIVYLAIVFFGYYFFYIFKKRRMP